MFLMKMAVWLRIGGNGWWFGTTVNYSLRLQPCAWGRPKKVFGRNRPEGSAGVC